MLHDSSDQVRNASGLHGRDRPEGANEEPGCGDRIILKGSPVPTRTFFRPSVATWDNGEASPRKLARVVVGSRK